MLLESQISSQPLTKRLILNFFHQSFLSRNAYDRALGCDVMNGRSKLTSQQLDVFQFLLLNDPAPGVPIAIRSSCPAPFKTKIPCEQIIAY